MKKFLLTICTMIIGIIGNSLADTSSISWFVDGTTYDTTTCTVGGDIILPTAPTKRGYTFMGWNFNLTPIEYLESTGTQYIDTGFKPNQDTRVVMKSQIVNQANHDNFIFGARTKEGVAEFTVTWTVRENRWRSDYGSSNYVFSDISSVTQKIKFDKNKNIVTAYDDFENVLFTLTNMQSNFTSGPNLIYPGGWSTTNDIFLFDGTIKIYSFQLYDNGTLVRDMIPVLDPYDVPCMYDKVSRQFFYNAGTGNFVAGPAIQE